MQAIDETVLDSWPLSTISGAFLSTINAATTASIACEADVFSRFAKGWGSPHRSGWR